MPNPDLIRVGAKSPANKVAGAIAGTLREYKQACVQAIGASAVNQAVKAIAIARSYLTNDSLALAATPVFTEVIIEGTEKTAICFYIEILHPENPMFQNVPQNIHNINHDKTEPEIA